MCIIESEALLLNGYRDQALASMVMGLEWIGTVLDKKPSGAKKQSRKRFELALAKMPGQYFQVHQEIDLYRQLRNRAIHNPWVKGRYLILTENITEHLSCVNGAYHFSIEKLQADLKDCLQAVSAT